MTLLFDKHTPIASPTLAPIVDDVGQDSAVRGELAIALINNMPHAALNATERQFQRLIQPRRDATASASIASRCRRSLAQAWRDAMSRASTATSKSSLACTLTG